MFKNNRSHNLIQGINSALQPLLGASAMACMLVAVCPKVWGDEHFYVQSNLVSDVAGVAEFTDTNLVGAWGTVHSSTSPWWVNTTASGLSLLFNGMGQPLPLIVAIPPTNPAMATGIVFNGGDGCQVEAGKPARFIFVTLNGTISGWNFAQANPKLAVLKVDNSAHAGYTGVTLAQRNG